MAGSIWLQSGRLSLGNFGYTPPPGRVFRIINNTGSNHIMGAFHGLPEGSYTQDSQHHVYRISYVGGDGNDVTLTPPRRRACPCRS